MDYSSSSFSLDKTIRDFDGVELIAPHYGVNKVGSKAHRGFGGDECDTFKPTMFFRGQDGFDDRDGQEDKSGLRSPSATGYLSMICGNIY
ncbi:hypothetical protein RB195_003826 [Necator americanus]|uniref:Transthyretin-like family protein n=1 Tax=Necator americanus TaxID=51031 RepID=A0ABR1DT34_NECAM